MIAASAMALLLRLGLLAAGASSFAMHVTTICRADSLLLGGALAMLYRSKRWTGVQHLAPWGFVGVTIAIVASIVLLEPVLTTHPLGYVMWGEGLRFTVLALGFASLIAWSLKSDSACHWIFQRGWLRFLGKYSYGIYVLHVLVLAVMNLPLRAALLGLTHSKLVAVVGAGLTSLTVSIAAAYLSYHLYERPFLRLKHHFDYARPTLNHGSPEDAEVEEKKLVGGSS